MNQLKFNNKIKYLLISGTSFSLSIIIINISFYFTNDEQLSAKLCLILLFIINLFLLLNFYKTKVETKKFIFIFLISSIFFRLYEYFLFNFFLNQLDNLNMSWFLALIISFISKFIFFDKVFN